MRLEVWCPHPPSAAVWGQHCGVSLAPLAALPAPLPWNPGRDLETGIHLKLLLSAEHIPTLGGRGEQGAVLAYQLSPPGGDTSATDSPAPHHAEGAVSGGLCLHPIPSAGPPGTLGTCPHHSFPLPAPSSLRDRLPASALMPRCHPTTATQATPVPWAKPPSGSITEQSKPPLASGSLFPLPSPLPLTSGPLPCWVPKEGSPHPQAFPDLL